MRRKTNIYGMWEGIRDVICDKQGVVINREGVLTKICQVKSLEGA